MNSPPFSLSVPAEPRFLKAVRAFFRGVLGEVCGDEAEMVVLALDESCSNVLKHRRAGVGGGLLRVDAQARPESVSIRIHDFCSPEDVPQIKPRDLKAVRPGGLGTHFVGEIMDRVDFEADPGDPRCVDLVLEKALWPRKCEEGAR